MAKGSNVTQRGIIRNLSHWQTLSLKRREAQFEMRKKVKDLHLMDNCQVLTSFYVLSIAALADPTPQDSKSAVFSVKASL